MIFDIATLQGIRSGAVGVAFRRWRRPGVKAGTRLRTAVGVVRVDAVEVVDAVSEQDARDAGFPSHAALVKSLRAGEDRALYRVRVAFDGEDPRAGLRADDELTATDLRQVGETLARMDTRGRRGAWTRQALELIERRPATVARELAAEAGRETLPFKTDVRKLKELGLTESLDVGYRLSPRGIRVLEYLRSR